MTFLAHRRIGEFLVDFDWRRWYRCSFRGKSVVISWSLIIGPMAIAFVKLGRIK